MFFGLERVSKCSETGKKVKRGRRATRIDLKSASLLTKDFQRLIQTEEGDFMKDTSKKMQVYCALLVFVLFMLFGATKYFNLPFNYYDIALTALFMTTIILTFRIGLIKGLILSAMILFLYGSMVFFQLISGSGEIWTLNYIWFIAFPIVIVLAGLISQTFEELDERERHLNQYKEKIVTVDDVTGFANAREFLRELDSEMARARRHKIDLTLMVIQIQYFEELLSIYGKNNASKIFKTLAEAVNASTRIEDFRYRIDDEIFAVVLPYTNKEQATFVYNRIKTSLGDLEIEDDSSLRRYKIEVKIGSVVYHPDYKNPMAFKAQALKELEYDV